MRISDWSSDVCSSDLGDVGRLMQRLGTNYVGLFNARHARTGTLWEGRYKSCLVDSEDYVLRCHRYIELNPVRARLTDDPATYRWSSCPAYLGQRPTSDLCEHPVWQGLAGSQQIGRAHVCTPVHNAQLGCRLLFA